MTTETATRPERSEAPERCQMERNIKPCWREATENLIDDAPGFEVCAEHYRAFQLGRAMDPLLDALEKMGEWIRQVDEGGDSPLEEYAFHMREQAYSDYWRAKVAHKAAYLIAIQGEDEEPLSNEQAERIGELLLRAEELSRVRLILEAQGEWELVAAIVGAEKATGEELDRYQREIGRK